ncbi:transcriptional regulator, SARP family [[Actinomadura] parvosata subsp. kistnae]|uniref:AfsR/SARP family transcriptional regulator n=1 Tax=[Actinomadura] parvosata TaxID=1955412 RepID=UPI000D2DD603|nr:transcriptional regulator, SARP family [Actinomadura parvosata subsp. kistnae]
MREQPAPAPHGLTVGVLGVLEVAVDGRPVPLTTGRLRTLLAVLAMSASAPVSMKLLTEALWPDAQPRNSRRSLQIYAARLRETLGRERIETRQDGLLLHADPDGVDALRFERILAQAAAERGSPANARSSSRPWRCGGASRSTASAPAGWRRFRRRA